MQCLHKLPAGTSETENGLFWFCKQNPTCHFICSEDEGFLFENAIIAYHKTGQPQPKCCGENLAKLRVVKDMMKESYGHPFFVCSKDANKCEYFEWADEIILPKPRCYHNEVCRRWTVKKEGSNKGKRFFCCAKEQNDGKCKFFQWTAEEEKKEEEEGDADTPPTQKDPKKEEMTKKSKKNLCKQRNVPHFCFTQDKLKRGNHI